MIFHHRESSHTRIGAGEEEKVILFKTDRQKSDFEQLKSKNPRIVRLATALSEFCELELKKDITVTDVFRTQEEFEALYSQTPPEKRPPTSPHMRWEALDLRSSVFTDREIERMLAFLNCFSYQGGQRKVALYHTIAGNVAHFHIQYA
jgi:hypothetical protein